MLYKIEESIFKSFPDYNGKKFKGEVTGNGFEVKVMGNEYLSFIGKFVSGKNNEEILEVSIGVKYFDVLILVFLLGIFIPFYTDENSGTTYGIIFVCLGLATFMGYSYYNNSKNMKKIFFDVLKNLDQDCKIISINKFIY
ncbi:hypothetical protein [Chryseobacterium viscerum]|uniref:hypothetical protein n=1 Tax=Chryseobacterium viscerum TaxID=1037377 RepID=UPI0012E0A860|nr:hypothetical protein [Chryseobacterium viscerum]MCW1962852.1 hypothetical protein [Chryseobacterium viscerum]